MGRNQINSMLYNWNVIGHGPTLATLEKDLANNNIPHAYLFVGPEKVGKFRVAKSLAKILQCPNNFCHTCPTCVQIEKKCHIDTIELEDDGESVKIAEVRELITRLSMTGQGRYKVVLLQNIGRLQEEATNSLLKTIEEPPEKTIFIFTAGQLGDILPTIASRMRIVHFQKLHDDVLRDALKNIKPDISEDFLGQIITLSLGRSGKAIQLLEDPEMFTQLRDLYTQIRFLDEKASVAIKMLSVQEIAADPQTTRTFLALMAHYFRQKMLDGTTEKEKNRAINAINEIHKVLELLGHNVNPRLLLENIMIRL